MLHIILAGAFVIVIFFYSLSFFIYRVCIRRIHFFCLINVIRIGISPVHLCLILLLSIYNCEQVDTRKYLYKSVRRLPSFANTLLKNFLSQPTCSRLTFSFRLQLRLKRNAFLFSRNVVFLMIFRFPSRPIIFILPQIPEYSCFHENNKKNFQNN